MRGHPLKHQTDLRGSRYNLAGGGREFPGNRRVVEEAIIAALHVMGAGVRTLQELQGRSGRDASVQADRCRGWRVAGERSGVLEAGQKDLLEDSCERGGAGALGCACSRAAQVPVLYARQLQHPRNDEDDDYDDWCAWITCLISTRMMNSRNGDLTEHCVHSRKPVLWTCQQHLEPESNSSHRSQESCLCIDMLRVHRRENQQAQPTCVLGSVSLQVA
jgi:hypothetical protein